MKSVLKTFVTWLLFVGGLAACLGAGAVLDGTEKNIATWLGTAVALVTGSQIARRDPIKSFLATRPVLWFLFLFNVSAAIAAYFAVGGIQGLLTAIGLGVVGLGAGAGLLRGRRDVTSGGPTAHR